MSDTGRWRRTDFDANGHVVRGYQGLVARSRAALVANIGSFHESGIVIGEPRTDDLVAVIVFRSQLGYPTPYIAVFRHEEVS